MKKILLSSAFLTIALLIGAACQTASTANMTASNNGGAANKTATPADVHADDAPRISLEDAKKDFDAGKAIFVDTRGEAAYKNEHIKGAINITSETLEAKYKELAKNQKIIAYCS